MTEITQMCFSSCVCVCIPRIPALTKWTRLKYSSRSFWIGVPDMSTLLWALMAFRAWYVWLSEFFSRWPYSIHVTSCHQESLINLHCNAWVWELNDVAEIPHHRWQVQLCLCAEPQHAAGMSHMRWSVLGLVLLNHAEKWSSLEIK